MGPVAVIDEPSSATVHGRSLSCVIFLIRRWSLLLYKRMWQASQFEAHYSHLAYVLVSRTLLLLSGQLCYQQCMQKLQFVALPVKDWLKHALQGNKEREHPPLHISYQNAVLLLRSSVSYQHIGPNIIARRHFPTFAICVSLTALFGYNSYTNDRSCTVTTTNPQAKTWTTSFTWLHSITLEVTFLSGTDFEFRGYYMSRARCKILLNSPDSSSFSSEFRSPLTCLLLTKK